MCTVMPCGQLDGLTAKSCIIPFVYVKLRLGVAFQFGHTWHLLGRTGHDMTGGV